jgi:hypothetical protein
MQPHNAEFAYRMIVEEMAEDRQRAALARLVRLNVRQRRGSGPRRLWASLLVRISGAPRPALGAFRATAE